jgi:hypothetical protein
MILLCGDLWQHHGDCIKLQNMLIDVYKAEPAGYKKVYSAGLDSYALVFTLGYWVQDGPRAPRQLNGRTTCGTREEARGGSVPRTPFLGPLWYRHGLCGATNSNGRT